MKRIILTLTLAVALASPVWAAQGGETGNTGCNGVGNPGSPCIGGQGGAGGAGGAGGDASASAAASATAISTAVSTSHASAYQSQGQGQEQGQGQIQGQSYQGEQNVTVKTDVPRMAPSAVPAALSVSSLTCYGSWSIAASTPFGGVGAGFPTKDSDCERSRNAALLNVLGYPGAALALMAQNEDTAKALKAAGVKVPTQVAEVVAPVPVATAPAPAPVVATASKPENPACGDGKPATITPSGFYSCAAFRK
jgi:hypothetical protein